MIIDRYNRYSKDQAITASGATVSESVVDLLAAGDAIGHERYLHILCKEAVAGTLTTVQFSLYTDSDEIVFDAQRPLAFGAQIRTLSIMPVSSNEPNPM